MLVHPFCTTYSYTFPVFPYRVMHATMFDLIFHRYTETDGDHVVAYKELGFHLACSLAGCLPKTSFDVMLWRLGTVFLLANFSYPDGRHE